MKPTRILTNWTDYPLGKRIVEVVVDRPDKLNALDFDLTVELAQAFAQLRDTQACAVILTGAGDNAFIGGADVNILRELTPDTAREYITAVQPSLRQYSPLRGSCDRPHQRLLLRCWLGNSGGMRYPHS